MPETPQPAEPCPCICHMGPRPRGVLHSRACCPNWNGNLDGPAGDSLPHIEARVRRDERERYEGLLGSIWLYIGWRSVTGQLTTEQREMFANAVEAWSRRGDAPVSMDRWWRDDAPTEPR